MPKHSKPLHSQLFLEASVQHSKFSLCKKAFQGLKISSRASEIHSTENIGAMGHEQFKSDPSKYVAKREKRKDDSILLRHVHGSSQKYPKSISWQDSECMKTNFLFTDVGAAKREMDELASVVDETGRHFGRPGRGRSAKTFRVHV